MRFTESGIIKLHILLKAHQHRTRACVSRVVDSGTGISRSALPYFFEPYQQAGNAATSQMVLALGLSISRRLSACNVRRYHRHQHGRTRQRLFSHCLFASSPPRRIALRCQCRTDKSMGFPPRHSYILGDMNHSAACARNRLEQSPPFYRFSHLGAGTR